MKIHPSAIVHPKAELAEDVEIGAFAFIGEHVKLGRGTRVLHHGVVEGHTTMGENNEVGPFSVIGGNPQDLKYKGEPTKLIIGNNNLFRENVTINTGTVTGTGVTTIGNHCLIMAYAHVAHDCVVGNNVILANYTGLSGHVTLEDYVILSGMVGVVQFCRVGKHAFIGGQTGIDKNVPPYMIGVATDTPRVQIRGVNMVGLKRRGFDEVRIRAVLDTYKIFYDSGKEKQEALVEIEEKFGSNEDVRYFIDFVRSSGKQGIAR